RERQFFARLLLLLS
ncbi:hypothetical protein TYRP_014654, partial [Tyrophagus putrescentiae]